MENFQSLCHLNQSDMWTRKSQQLWKPPNKGVENHTNTLTTCLGWYSLKNNNAATVRKHSNQFNAPLNESTIWSLKKNYLRWKKERNGSWWYWSGKFAIEEPHGWSLRVHKVIAILISSFLKIGTLLIIMITGTIKQCQLPLKKSPFV